MILKLNPFQHEVLCVATEIFLTFALTTAFDNTTDMGRRESYTYLVDIQGHRQGGYTCTYGFIKVHIAPTFFEDDGNKRG